MFWAFAAALLASAMPGLGSFGRLLMISECVGLSMLAGAALLGFWMKAHHFGGRWRLPLAWLAALPLGYTLGHGLAFLLLGEPVFQFGQVQDRMVPILFTALTAALGLLYFATRDRLAGEQAVAARAELRLLRAQLEPHMLFNTLANLRALIDEEGQGPQALAMLDQLIAYLRGVLAASRAETCSLRAEFAQLRAYLEIMRFRMGPRLSYELDLPEALQDLTLPPMLLQPLVENAIRHGIEPSVGPGRIEARVRRTAAGLEIVISDTGPGLDPALPGGYGLQHVRQRLLACYGPAAGLSLMNGPGGGLVVTAKVPM
ncbi:MAG: histidine kinase [Burkholderiaceae bacterium]|nr:histidine kinase [Burkholderiaceae bacterium]